MCIYAPFVRVMYVKLCNDHVTILISILRRTQLIIILKKITLFNLWLALSCKLKVVWSQGSTYFELIILANFRTIIYRYYFFLDIHSNILLTSLFNEQTNTNPKASALQQLQILREYTDVIGKALLVKPFAATGCKNRAHLTLNPEEKYYHQDILFAQFVLLILWIEQKCMTSRAQMQSSTLCAGEIR